MSEFCFIIVRVAESVEELFREAVREHCHSLQLVPVFNLDNVYSVCDFEKPEPGKIAIDLYDATDTQRLGLLMSFDGVPTNGQLLAGTLQ